MVITLKTWDFIITLLIIIRKILFNFVNFFCKFLHHAEISVKHMHGTNLIIYVYLCQTGFGKNYNSLTFANQPTEQTVIKKNKFVDPLNKKW